MRLSLHSLVLTPVLAVAAMAAPQSASAARLHAPFAFSVSGQTLPAGDYSVSRALSGNMVVLTSPNSDKTFTWVLVPGDPEPDSTRIVMRFDETESGYALRNIQYDAGITRTLDGKSRQTEDRPVHVIRGE